MFNTSYDKDLKKITSIVRLPWVGIDYKNESDSDKLLILGESVYDWKPSDPENIKKIAIPDNLRNLHVNHALAVNRKSKYVRNVERAVYSRKRPSADQKLSLWNSVVYHNLVTRVMKTKKHRPTYKDYLDGWSTFKQVVKVLKPNKVIVYGLESKKIASYKEVFSDSSIMSIRKTGDKVGKSHVRTSYLNIDGHEVKILFMKHPSSFYSWDKWSVVIDKELNLQKSA